MKGSIVCSELGEDRFVRSYLVPSNRMPLIEALDGAQKHVRGTPLLASLQINQPKN